MIEYIQCGTIESVDVLGATEAEAERTVAEFAALCPSARFGPVASRVTGHFGAFGSCSAADAEVARFLFE